MSDFIARVNRSLLGPFSALTQYRSLTSELSKREVLGRYRGANFGMLWSLFSPFLMLGVYTFAFGGLMRSRWPEGQHQSFALILFIGLIIHGFFSECIMRAPTLVVGNANYVKRVIFPLEILPWPMMLSALFHLITNFLVFLVLGAFLNKSVPIQSFLFPVVIAPLVILAVGLSWLFAAIGVYFRDIMQVVNVISAALLFTSSAIMPLQAVPEKYRFVFLGNPLTFIIDQARNVALWGHWPDWSGLLLYTGISLVIAYLSYGFFRMTRRGFADVI
jgi:lipopolysaccharide transport system permease protein